ncbi:MAG: PaaI family thioesterase [Rhizobiales bacterium]|nr:PaaI family thioesterase [Hyphomicrobiales bacterium]
MSKISVSEMQNFFDREFPQSGTMGEITHLGTNFAQMKLIVDNTHLRPGGTVSGPAMMALADVTLYAAILNEIGLVALAVTTNLNINFLRKPQANCPIIAKATLIKLGRSLAVGEVAIYSEGSEDMVAHATLTYSIPPKR